MHSGCAGGYAGGRLSQVASCLLTISPVHMPPRVLLIGTFLSSSLRALSPSEELAERLMVAGWDVQVASTRRARLPRLADYLATAWRRRHTYDVANVDVYSGAAFAWAEAVCAVLQAARKPYTLTLHGGNLPAFVRKWPRRAQRLLRAAAVVTAPSGYLIEHVRHIRDDVRLLPNALDLDRYQYRERDRPEPKLIWLRAFHRIYDPPLAPEVVARLVRRYPGVSLTMLGSDKGDGSLRDTRDSIDRLGLGARVALPGGVPKAEVPLRLQEGDIFLNTTDVDNTPVSVLEAMACGLCVVSTAVGGIPYLIQDGVNGILVPPRDADAMAAAVDRILSERGIGRSLSYAGRRMVECFDWKQILPRWQELLCSVARTGG